MTVELRFMPCGEFEQSIHEFVDQELAPPDIKSLLVHLELCGGCSDAVESLRRQVRAHQDADELQAVLATFDGSAFETNLYSTLLTANLERLTSLLYELGKAYFHAGNDSRLISFLHKKAVAIERSQAEGRRLVKETAGLAGKAGRAPRKVSQSIRRSDQLFRGRRAGRIGSRTGRGPLDNARRYLEECLILQPEHPQARIYLGYYFVRVDRPEEGLSEYRKLLSNEDLSISMRVMGLQAMGNAHAYRLDYDRAIECFEEILTLGVLSGTNGTEADPRFFTVLLSLAMFHAKQGRFSRSAETFGELVERFPQMLERARTMLEQAGVFRTLLSQQEGFRSELLRRYPMLFAS